MAMGEEIIRLAGRGAVEEKCLCALLNSPSPSLEPVYCPRSPVSTVLSPVWGVKPKWEQSRAPAHERGSLPLPCSATLDSSPHCLPP